LRHVYPQADIPVVQLSVDETQSASFHYELGKRLALLREEGILIFGSGNVVHNLHAYAWGRHAPAPYDWAISFETRIRELLLAEEYKPLLNYEHQLGSEAELAVPTPDHYLPLLYVAGTRIKSELLTFPVEGVDGGSVSMLAVQVGAKSLPAHSVVHSRGEGWCPDLFRRSATLFGQNDRATQQEILA
jgi:4,5-DOPA dioxygenase extradiol